MAQLQIVVDTSGSMAEGGKMLIARGVVRAIEQYFRFGYAAAEIRLLAAGKEVREIPWTPDEEYPACLFEVGGSLDAVALAAFLNETSGQVVLISDVAWDSAVMKMLQRWNLSHPGCLRVLKVGVEKSLVRGLEVFSAEDVLELLDDWIEA